ncbi:HK97 gp10 family phage protein [Olivibacter sp. LS-1]|uniref:HK97 gp10 family phage protein n=1 Tax=Olivibacter sp. LS-1 TaxID=2592345 RepID=UPI0011EB786F|nr:HK97 gp10 family phage protein [Olivibacter sp. LS-1]QEL01139.1 HK97 gp10 family phage protein [Olivibacter sp. LS-1]
MPLKGLKSVLSAFKFFQHNVTRETKRLVFENAEDVEFEAIKNCPVDMGGLRQSIYKEMTNDGFSFRIIVDKEYGPYIEFGTKSKVSIPAGLEEYANQFRGSKGGNFDVLLENIKEWVKRHGLPDEAALPIAMNIARFGITARPFLIPAYNKVGIDFVGELKKTLGG